MSKRWSRTNRYFVLALILIGLIWFLVAARELIGPLAISALLAFVLNPAVTFVNGRTKLKRGLVIWLVFLIALAILITVITIFAPVIPEQVRSLLGELENIQLQLEERLASPLVFLGFHIPLDTLLADLGVMSVEVVRPDVILGIIEAASTNLVWVFVILVTTYYLLQDWPLLREWLFRQAPESYRYDARRLYEEVKVVWERYLRGQLVLTFVIGILVGVISAAIGLPGAAAFGLLAGILVVIPSAGPIAAMVIAALVALFAGSTYLPLSNNWFTLLVLALYYLVHIMETIWLRPRIMGQTLRIHPGVILVAVIGSLALAGVLTALIIIPVLGSAGIIGRYLYVKILDIEPESGEMATVSGQVRPETPEDGAHTKASSKSPGHFE